jgi:AI-2 transport system ATP-binding protein
MGITSPTTGARFFTRQAPRLGKPSGLAGAGIYLGAQEPMLFPNMTVEENVLMGFMEKASSCTSGLRSS